MGVKHVWGNHTLVLLIPDLNKLFSVCFIGVSTVEAPEIGRSAQVVAFIHSESEFSEWAVNSILFSKCHLLTQIFSSIFHFDLAYLFSLPPFQSPY